MATQKGRTKTIYSDHGKQRIENSNCVIRETNYVIKRKDPYEGLISWDQEDQLI